MKKILLIIIVIVGLGGALIMGYMAMQSSDTPASTTSTTSSKPLKSTILPEGTELDLDKVKDFNKDRLMFPYPKVSPTEIGVVLPSIVE